MSRLMTAVSDRHVEIMRDDLSEIFYDATCDEVEYMFGDSITSISQSGQVTFEHRELRRFDRAIIKAGSPRLGFRATEPSPAKPYNTLSTMTLGHAKFILFHMRRKSASTQPPIMP